MKTFKEIRAPKIKKGLRDKKGKLHTVDMKLDGSKLSFKVTDEFGSFKTVNAKGLAKMFEETVIDQITKEGLDEVAAKVNPRAMAADIPQMKLSKFLKKASRKPMVYFDGDDLVDVDKTVVRGALDPKKKITVQKLIDALTESVDF
jgi:hypothetical protein